MGGGVPILRTLPLDLPLSTAGVHQAIMSIYHVASYTISTTVVVSTWCILSLRYGRWISI